MGEPTGLLRVEDALIESSFRRLLSAIESEKDGIRQQQQELDLEREVTTAEIQNRRDECENWVRVQQKAIDDKMNELEKRMALVSNFWKAEGANNMPPLKISCSSGGVQKLFTLPRSTLRGVKESDLARLFSDEMLPQHPRDEEGRIMLDFNPICFSLIVEYLQNRRLRPDCAIPHIPKEQQTNMELLAERLKMTPFLQKNGIADVHSTSLQVIGNSITATHPSWQVISSKRSLSVTRASYLEITVEANPDTKGALAVGLCNRIPSGDEAYSIRIADSVLCVSNAGLKGDMCENDEMGRIRPVELKKGAKLGIRYSPPPSNASSADEKGAHLVTWYYNKECLGTTRVRDDLVRNDRVRTLFAIFAMYIPDQKVKVEFDLTPPQDVPALTG